MSYCLKLANGLAKLGTRACIGDSLFEQAIHRADVTGEEANPFPVHGMREHGCSGTDLTEHRLCRNPHILKHQLSERSRSHAHLLELLVGIETRSIAIYQKGRYPPIISFDRISEGKNDDQVRNRSVGDKNLGSVDSKPASIWLSFRP